MTLKELYKQISALNSQHIDTNIPLVQDGKEVDLRLSLNDDLTVELSGCLKWREK